jgi:hypothetical protein
MNTSNPFDSSLGLRADDDDAQPNLRRFKHRLIADGIESVCLRCCQLVGSAQDEWLLLSLEQVHLCLQRPAL